MHLHVLRNQLLTCRRPSISLVLCMVALWRCRRVFLHRLDSVSRLTKLMRGGESALLCRGMTMRYAAIAQRWLEHKSGINRKDRAEQKNGYAHPGW